MKTIFMLTDYNGYFGLKWKANPYRSGFDRSLLVKYFNKYGYDVEFLRLADVVLSKQKWDGQIVFYTSSENLGDNYKSYIEDIVYGLELSGAHTLPAYKFLRAHNNKVFMELLRDIYLGTEFDGCSIRYFGTYEEIARAVENHEITFPCVIKKASGAMSKGVAKAENPKSLLTIAKDFCRTPHLLFEVKDYLRTFRIKGYKNESRYQGKCVIQPFIPSLQNDWKVLIFGDQYYILKRHVRPNDFRASGSHVDYKSGVDAEFPIHMLNYLENIYNIFDVPHLSLDFGFDGSKGYIFEFQTVFFGTSTQYISTHYYIKEKSEWIVRQKEFDQEEVYVWGVVKYLERHPDLLK